MLSRRRLLGLAGRGLAAAGLGAVVGLPDAEIEGRSYELPDVFDDSIDDGMAFYEAGEEHWEGYVVRGEPVSATVFDEQVRKDYELGSGHTITVTRATIELTDA